MGPARGTMPFLEHAAELRRRLISSLLAVLLAAIVCYLFYEPVLAVLFGSLHVGSGAMQREAAVPLPIVWVIEGVVILAFLVYGRVRPPSASPVAG